MVELKYFIIFWEHSKKFVEGTFWTFYLFKYNSLSLEFCWVYKFFKQLFYIFGFVSLSANFAKSDLPKNVVQWIVYKVWKSFKSSKNRRKVITCLFNYNNKYIPK